MSKILYIYVSDHKVIKENLKRKKNKFLSSTSQWKVVLSFAVSKRQEINSKILFKK